MKTSQQLLQLVVRIPMEALKILRFLNSEF